MTVDELEILINANTGELKKQLKDTNKKISGLSKSASKSCKDTESAFSKLKSGIVALGIGKIIKDSIQSGMDAIESDSLFDTSLGKNADSVRAWSEEMANSLGLSEYAVRKNTGTIFNMTSSMGIAEENALKMSKGIALLSEDMASFYNLSSEEAFNKLRGGITGEAEGLKALGILVDENTVKQVAYSEGIAENGAELTQQQKVLARYVAIMKQTSNAQGDLARTIDSPSNQLRMLKQQVTNLGIAFSNFLMPILNAVLPYLTALTKIVTKGAKSLATFMGLIGGDSGASEETQEISDNTSSISGGLDDATDSAKKLKKQLAGFDEMNVLSDNSEDSAGTSSGATVGVDFDLSEYDSHLDWIQGNTGDIAAKIEGIFSSLGENIDWTNLLTSFAKLKTAISGVAGDVWDGLKWAFENILKPLAEWTIEDAVPSFFDSLSTALFKIGDIDYSGIGKGLQTVKKSVSPFVNNVGEGLNWFLQNVLVPIASWTVEDVIPGFLNLVSGAVDVVNQAIEDFKPVFSWFWENVLSPIADWTGGVIASVLSAIGDALKWISDNGVAMAILEAIAITIGLVAAAFGIYNVAIAVATAVTGAFGAVMAVVTSPIFLVAAAIAAVIAIIIICVKYWDEIKEAASKCWEGIKNVWNTVCDWFDTNIIQPIKDFFTGLWDGIKNIFTTVVDWIKDNWKALLLILVNPFAGAFKLIYDNCEGFKNIVDNVVKAIKNFFVNLWTSIKNIFSSVGTWFKDVFTKAWNGIKTAFSSVGSFFSGIWDSIKKIFSKVGSTIGDAVSGAFKNAINWVLDKAISLINGFIKGINFAIGIINKIPGVEIKKIDLLEAPKLAKGGITTGSTLANIGEAGREAVLPLENNLGYLDKFAEKIAEKIHGAGDGMKLVVKLGEEAIFDRFIEFGKDKAFETNGEVVFA